MVGTGQDLGRVVSSPGKCDWKGRHLSAGAFSSRGSPSGPEVKEGFSRMDEEKCCWGSGENQASYLLGR